MKHTWCKMYHVNRIGTPGVNPGFNPPPLPPIYMATIQVCNQFASLKPRLTPIAPMPFTWHIPPVWVDDGIV